MFSSKSQSFRVQKRGQSRASFYGSESLVVRWLKGQAVTSFVVMEAGELISLESASAFAGQSRGTSALTGRMRSQRDPLADLRDGDRRSVFFSAACFRHQEPRLPER